MSDKLKSFILVYSWSFVLLLITVLHDVHANTRAILLLVGYSPVLVVHLRIALDHAALKQRKSFIILTSLWITLFCLIFITEGIQLIINYNLLALNFLTLIIQLIIAMLVSVSFMINVPFFYRTTENKVFVIVGGVIFICTMLLVIILCLSLFDLYSGHWSFIHKRR